MAESPVFEKCAEQIQTLWSKERIYGKNQVVESIDENSTRVKADMQNKENIIVFLMGFNKYIKVIEPQKIKEEIINRLEILKENCK